MWQHLRTGMMQFQDLLETGSYGRFFLEMVAIYLLAAAFAFCLITAAYSDGRVVQYPSDTASLHFPALAVR
jgi:hypothetical protein